MSTLTLRDLSCGTVPPRLTFHSLLFKHETSTRIVTEPTYVSSTRANAPALARLERIQGTAHSELVRAGQDTSWQHDRRVRETRPATFQIPTSLVDLRRALKGADRTHVETHGRKTGSDGQLLRKPLSNTAPLSLESGLTKACCKRDGARAILIVLPVLRERLLR